MVTSSYIYLEQNSNFNVERFYDPNNADYGSIVPNQAMDALT